MSAVDQIIVKTHADFTRIADWLIEYLREEHKGDLTAPVEFVPPFNEGEIIFQEEPTIAKFKYLGHGDVAFDVTSGKNLTHVGTFIFNYSTTEVSHRTFDMKHVDVLKAMAMDNERHYCQNLGVKWLTLMLLALYYRPEVERTRHTTATRKPAKKGKRKGSKLPKLLYTRQYVLTGDLVDELPKVPRHHAKPQHEFNVKGHFRRYKSGKTAWINPHTRCKGRGEASGSTYVARIREETEDGTSKAEG